MALRLHVTFPDCWDCRRLDNLGHKSHAAYSTRAVCSASHPVAIPRISLIYTYSGTGGPGVSRLGQPELRARHFFNAWDAAELERLVSGCLNALRHCQRGD